MVCRTCFSGATPYLSSVVHRAGSVVGVNDKAWYLTACSVKAAIL